MYITLFIKLLEYSIYKYNVPGVHKKICGLFFGSLANKRMGNDKKAWVPLLNLAIDVKKNYIRVLLYHRRFRRILYNVSVYNIHLQFYIVHT